MILALSERRTINAWSPIKREQISLSAVLGWSTDLILFWIRKDKRLNYKWTLVSSAKVCVLRWMKETGTTEEQTSNDPNLFQIHFRASVTLNSPQYIKFI